MRIIHPIDPVYNEQSKILILGSFPSVKSRESMFFYGHKQNRFWKVLAAIFQDNLPVEVEEKRAFLLSHNIAVWDVIAECDIEGSSDASIKNVLANDLTRILDIVPDIRIFCNGNKSYELYVKYIENSIGKKAVKLPSTSPANAAMSLDKLISVWGEYIR